MPSSVTTIGSLDAQSVIATPASAAPTSPPNPSVSVSFRRTADLRSRPGVSKTSPPSQNPITSQTTANPIVMPGTSDAVLCGACVDTAANKQPTPPTNHPIVVIAATALP